MQGLNMYADILTSNSFDSPWYWLLVATLWVRAIQWTLGIPNDVMRAAQNGDASAHKDALALMDMHIRSVTRDFNQFGMILVLMTCFVLASFATLGFWNDVTMLQGVFLISFPMVLIGGMDIRLASRLQKQPVDWADLCRIYRKQRWLKFALGLLFLLISMMWALFLQIRPLLEQL